MRTRRVRWGTTVDTWAHALYLRAFPAEERISWALIHLLTLRRGIDLVTWWDVPETEDPQAVPVALTLVLHRPGEDLVYLLYFAVDDAARGKGIGTAVLDELRRRYPGADLALDIEPVVEQAPNLEQRRRRLAFYERAGLRDTGLSVTDPTGEYWSLSDAGPGRPVDAERLRRVLSLTDFGLGGVKVEPRR